MLDEYRQRRAINLGEALTALLILAGMVWLVCGIARWGCVQGCRFEVQVITNAVVGDATVTREHSGTLTFGSPHICLEPGVFDWPAAGPRDTEISLSRPMARIP